MNDAWAIVIASLITAISGIFITAVSTFKKMHKENREDHGQVMKKLDNVVDGLDSVSERLDGHIDWHLHKK
jgi:hypothetical protein